MNTLILNRDFRLPDDGWYQIAPFGEFPHEGAGIVQVIDREACDAMVARFAADAAVPNFAGLLVDFDHFSLDGEKRSEAAGWILGLEARGLAESDGSDVSDRSDDGHAGLWARIRWSDVGEAAVKGGRYRFLSPVWARSDCIDLGDGRFRPVRMLNAAVTNDPNLKGMVPLSNASTSVRSDRGDRLDSVPVVEGAQSPGRIGKGERSMKAVIERLVNHLGLAADASEAVILERMAGLPSLTAVTDVQNSLRDVQGKYDAVVANLKKVEGELVNRHLADFEGVISEGAKAFWAEQLVQNREGALAALEDVARAKSVEGEPTPATGQPSPSTELRAGKEGAQSGARRPLHNRATARPVPPGQGGSPSTGSGSADGRAVRIRNRAHEIAKAEKVPFSTAFRRAEKEICEQ